MAPPRPGQRSRRPTTRPPKSSPPTSGRSRQRIRRPRKPWKRLFWALGAAGLLWLSRGWWWPAPPPPQLILVLGGDVAREQRAAELAQRDGLPVVVTGGSNPEYAHWLFQQRVGLPSRQVQLDYRAHDTLSNFTSLVDELRRARIRHALLVTSSDHMERALLVGRIVAGSRGIQLTPVAVPCGQSCHQEGPGKVWGDGARAVLWVITGHDIRHWLSNQPQP
ncbi:YdcF family protein [Cyanobium sp. HWJ4-Hawea]|uniref:YdcF family protein n=1 Tax=unclassified Cyanobium TaxID=2627006 RepID=UPI0020CD1EFE|nr:MULTISPECIES: YdcF family protein [unclassified Cyanobium]MCP9775326.1 YdcF family protein [Cyanobium sp. WAJ14-Wanaka]MCP9810071.1 YdcF family protein [Cyanobium sp. HWJ4-Hawea]